jgi:hypothetical protein
MTMTTMMMLTTTMIMNKTYYSVSIYHYLSKYLYIYLFYSYVSVKHITVDMFFVFVVADSEYCFIPLEKRDDNPIRQIVSVFLKCVA